MNDNTDEIANAEAPERIWVDVYDGPDYSGSGSDWVLDDGTEPESDGLDKWVRYVRADTVATDALIRERDELADLVDVLLLANGTTTHCANCDAALTLPHCTRCDGCPNRP